MDNNDRVWTRISTRELNRRWSLVRKHMAETGVEAIVSLSKDDYFGGYAKWFTDVPAYGYSRCVVFHANDLMSVVDHGPIGGHRILKGEDPNQPGVGELHQTASFPAIDYSQSYEAEIIRTLLLKRGYRKVGLLAPGGMPAGFLNHLRESLSNLVAFSDETDAIDQMKAVKSEEEIGIIKATAKMQDIIFERVLPKIRPGMRNSDIAGLAQYEGKLLGSEQGIFMSGASKPGTPIRTEASHFQARRVEDGEQLRILIENNGPGGFYTELGRTIVFGKASEGLKEAIAIGTELQHKTAQAMKPGTPCADVYTLYNQELRRRGYPEELRVHAHSQGYDLVERPLIRSDETLKINAGMCMAIHPSVATAAHFIGICDNFLVQANGGYERIHETEQKVFEI